MKWILNHSQVVDRENFIDSYAHASNASTGSEVVVLCQDLVQHKMRNFNYFQLTNSDSLATLAL